MPSPTARTLEYLRSMGCMAAVVERWNPHVKPHGARQDLFGFIDLLALNATETLAVQATTGGHAANRVAKLTGECADNVRRWLACPSRSLEVWGWRKLKVKRGGKAVKWEVSRTRFGLTSDGRIVSAKLNQ